MKLLTPSDEYPESYWLSYDQTNNLDYLEFYKCKRLSITGAKPKMALTRKISVNAFRQYDYLFSDGPDLVGARLAGVINSSKFAGDVQLICADVTINGKSYDDYFIINYLRSGSAFDMVRSVHKPLIKSMPDGPKKFNSIVLLDKTPESGMFRALESNSHVVVSDDVAEYLINNSVRGIEFYSGKDGL
jgi:hypothetical protein